MSQAEFDAHLEAIASWTHHVLPLGEALSRVEAGTLPRRSVVLTFDDGYYSTLEQVWPRLRSRNWPATLYAVPGYLDGARPFPWDRQSGHPARLLSSDDLLLLARQGMDVGSHTVSHRWLPRLSDAELACELSDSRQFLEQLLSKPVTSIAYPAGHMNPRVRRAAAAAGYINAVAVVRGRTTATTDRYAVRRVVVPRSADELMGVLDGAYNFLAPIDAIRERRLLADPNRYPDPSNGDKQVCARHQPR